MWARFQDAMSAKKKRVLNLQELKNLHAVMEHNLDVTEENQALVVETLRAIAETVIWGDQNDPQVFDFFLEKDMISYFDRILIQDPGTFVATQLLQTLVILFDNISTPTSIWFLLSNNHMNRIISHKFDFTDEEVLAYYISFLRTLSMLLNRNTILFFRNEHLSDFPLYSEALKFFNHKESMVRVAVRTLTLNVYRAAAQDDEALKLIQDATPYFSNLVWVLGNLSVNMDKCLRLEADHTNKGNLESFVAEHLDHMHYMNDILSLGVAHLSNILNDQLINSLFVPLYVFCLEGQLEGTHAENIVNQKRIQPLTSLYLLAQVFLTFDEPHLINSLAASILLGNPDLGQVDSSSEPPQSLDLKQEEAEQESKKEPEQQQPSEKQSGADDGNIGAEEVIAEQETREERTLSVVAPSEDSERALSLVADDEIMSEGLPSNEPQIPSATGEDESLTNGAPPPRPPPPHQRDTATPTPVSANDIQTFSSLPAGNLSLQPGITHIDESAVHQGYGTVFRDTVYELLRCEGHDLIGLMSLSLIYSMIKCKVLHPQVLERGGLSLPTVNSQSGEYNQVLVSQVLEIIKATSDVTAHYRFATINVACDVCKILLMTPPAPSAESDEPKARCIINNDHFEELKCVRDSIIEQLRAIYEEMRNLIPRRTEQFLDTFEAEFRRMKPVNIGLLLSQATVLLVPTSSPVPGLDFEWRVPSNDEERVRKAIQIYILFRAFYLDLVQHTDPFLPLRAPPDKLSLNDSINLSEGPNLFSCLVVSKGRSGAVIQVRRVLLIDAWRLALLEPDNEKPGWATVRFVEDLANVENMSQGSNSRSLNVSITHPPTSNNPSAKRIPVFFGKFTFDNNIHCLTARQILEQSVAIMRKEKLELIEKLLGVEPVIPVDIRAPTPPTTQRGPPNVTSQPPVISTSPEALAAALAEGTVDPSAVAASQAQPVSPKMRGKSLEG
eukprot:m.87280 g.87280  ORF g.87280 m.87280 type:complete len:954 (+) comp13100_c0_seq1:313-3174(+)